ncbi:MAG: hypothetical protein LBT59_04640, partial [Clostridiales bacterium]|nr:hypothetical protein [Clostridiales bacterium]
KETNNALDTLIVAVGEGYIADYHFQKEEYDLAAYWYQAAKNDYSASNLVKDSEYDKRFSKGLVDSLMRMV